jgi:hypothetical protein
VASARPISLLRACVVTAAAVCVAGCVGMPASGPMGAISASPQTTAPGGDFIEPFPSGPSPDETPSGIVGGFLAASASYPVHAAIAGEYLTASASRTWNPGWTVTVFSTFSWSPRAVMEHPKHGASTALIDASGVVQSRFNGTGQFVSAQQGQSATTDAYRFDLVKVDGQWRISNPPEYRLLTVPEFGEFYRTQDLYFVNQSILNSPNQALVPDSVFVPLGSSVPDLVNNLVKALLPNPATAAGGPKSALLQNAAETFPVGTKLIGGVTLDGTTAVVNLSGLAKAGTTVLEQVSAQLTWTLAAAKPGPPQSIQSVELELDGKPWIPPASICGITQSRSSVQNQATYPCYNPYPSQPASFSFAARGQAWSRCGSETSALHGLVGPVVSIFRSAQQCGGSEDVPTTSASVPQSVPLPARVGTPSMVAVSADGAYVAVYSPDKKAVFAGLASAPGSLTQVQGGIGSGVTALSWDRNHDLWIAQNGNVFMAPVTGKAIQITAPAGVSSLSVAPDGVRIALIVPSAAGGTVELAAITHGGQSSQGQRGSISEAVAIGNSVQIGPDLIQPDMLTWYDADNLIVLSGSEVKTLSEVPVDGQQSSSSQPAPAGAISITADGSTNALVAGLSGSGGRLALSTGLEGPWQSLGVSGLNPSYPG